MGGRRYQAASEQAPRPQKCSVRWRLVRGFTLLEALLALTILVVGILTLYLTLSRAQLLMETNREIKVAVLQAASIAEEIIGVQFDSMMDPDYPSALAPLPRYRHMQYVQDYRLYGGTVTSPNPSRLTNEKVLVWYGDHIDTSNVTVAGNTNPVIVNANGTVTVQQALYAHVAAPLNLMTSPNSLNVTNLTPIVTPSFVPELNRPANNSPDGTQFNTPDPLFVTIQVTWTGPNNQPMIQRLTLVRSR